MWQFFHTWKAFKRCKLKMKIFCFCFLLGWGVFFYFPGILPVEYMSDLHLLGGVLRDVL